MEEEITKEFADKMIEPFETPTGAKLEALSAVSLLNRYCMTLPADVFTAVTVSWSKEETPDGVIVKVQLPMQSTVREPILVCLNVFIFKFDDFIFFFEIIFVNTNRVIRCPA